METVLTVEAVYTAVDRYMDDVDPSWREEQFREQLVTERVRFSDLFGPPEGAPPPSRGAVALYGPTSSRA